MGTRVDIKELDRAVECYFRSGLASSTQQTYASAKKQYPQFCLAIKAPPLPATESLLCRFVSQLANEKLSHSTIKGYLSGVRHLHVAEGYGDPHISDMARLEQVLRGIKRARSSDCSRRERLPVTPAILGLLQKAWKGAESGQMLWAVAALCFFGFQRSGEVTIPTDEGYNGGAHSFADIAVDCLEDPAIMRVRLKASKQSWGRRLCRQDRRHAMPHRCRPVLHGSKGPGSRPPIPL